MTRPTFTIVVVNYFTDEETARCVAAAHEQVPDAPILVVDNGSRRGFDGAPARLLRSGRNEGFAAACNRAIRAQPAEFHLLLNPDVTPRPGAIPRLVEFARARPRAGAVGGRVLNPDGSRQPSARRFYDWQTLLALKTPLGRLPGPSRWIEEDKRTADAMSASQPVDWLSGACLLLRAEALRGVGLLDPGYFVYFEDVDLCRRLGRAAWEVWYCADAEFVHGARRASARRPISPAGWHHLRGLLRFAGKFGVPWRRAVQRRTP